MTFLNRMLATIGIGAAKVDTQLDTATVRLGDPLTGRVVIRAGNVAQTIEYINLYLMTRVKHDDNYVNQEAARFTVSGRIDLTPGETREVPFSTPLPFDVPLSLNGTTLWLQTGAAISAAADPSDQDHIQILPNAPVEALLRGADRAGLRFHRAEVERTHGHGVRQELSFRAPHGMGLNEVEMILFPSHDAVDVILEVDRKARGIASLFVSEFETRARWHVTRDLIARGPDAIAQELTQRIRSM